MIGNLGHSHPVHPNGQFAPGGSAQSVGHQAKAAVAAAREAGADLPKNAQDIAASGLARGADPATLFASLIAPEAPVTDDPVSDPVGDPADPAPNSTAAGETGYAAGPDVAVETGFVPPSSDVADDIPPADGDQGAPAANTAVADPGTTAGRSAQDIALALLEEAASDPG